MYLSLAPVPLVPPSVVTVTSTVPVPAGAVAVILVAVAVTFVAGVAPKLTAMGFDSSVPLIVTVVPPVEGPAEGLTLVTVGPPT